MAIVGVTVDKQGNPKVRRSVTTKLAIGLPPDDKRNYPTKLDHIVFLKKVFKDKEIQWVEDEVLTQHYTADGTKCQRLWITFFDDAIETVFPHKWGAYKTRGLWCYGDGEHAHRRDLGKDGKAWNDFAPFSGKCANDNCPIAEAGDCKPNGTLYFFLQDFPKLGSLCKLNTTGFQSIAQIYSALQDLRSVTGGRLMGVSAKLFMHPDKTVFEQNGSTKTGMKWCWGLELAAADLKDMGHKMLESARTFREIKGELAGRVIEVEEDDAEIAREMTSEFYPPAGAPQLVQSTPIIEADPKIEAAKAQIEELLTSVGVNQANRIAIVSANQLRIVDLALEVKEIVYLFRASGEAVKAGAAIQNNARRLGAYLAELRAWYEKKKTSSNGNGNQGSASPNQGQQPAHQGAGAATCSGDSRPAAGPQDDLFISKEDTQPKQMPTVAQAFGGSKGRFSF